MKTSVQKLPLWLWWAIGMLTIAALAAGAVFAMRNAGPRLPPGLAEKRAEAARILEEAGRIQDVDIKPLTELDARGDFSSAASLMEQALAANDRQEELNAALTSVSEELARLAVGVQPDEAGARAIEAFGILARLADAERKFFTDRKLVYRIARDYYAGRSRNEKPPVPANLASLVDAVNADFAKTLELHRRFTAAVAAFDEAIRQ